MRRKGMRICLDVSAAVHRRAGIGRYVGELAAALAAADGEYEYTLFYNRASEAVLAPPLDCLPRLTSGLADKPWRLRVLLAQLARAPQDPLFPGVDLFHATDHLLPYLARVASVFTLYDLTVRLHPEAHTALNRWFLTLMLPRFLRRASAVVAISECTRRDAARLYGLDEATIRVVPGGVHPRFHPAEPEASRAVRRKYALPERMILYVGTLEPRKNLATLLEAYRALKDGGISHGLVIAGKAGWRYQATFRRLTQLGLEGEVILPGYIADEDLPALYSAADLFAFPSLYEGFGLPVLEAMACGTPVVCSNASSLPEVAGDAAILLDPRDAGAWARTMGRVLADPALAAELRARGLARATRFTWAACAQAMREVYRSLNPPGSASASPRA